MKLSGVEKTICHRYSKRVDGKVRCSECPLVLDRRLCICKSNATKKEWKEMRENAREYRF